MLYIIYCILYIIYYVFYYLLYIIYFILYIIYYILFSVPSRLGKPIFFWFTYFFEKWGKKTCFLATFSKLW